jgi:CheY-like chemotaxis protein
MHLGIPAWLKSEDSHQKLNVLLVDDQATFRELIRRFLMVSGFADFRFQEAADGAEALRHFNPKTVDLVFMDQHLPGASGVCVATKMRELSGGRHVPIIFATGDGKVGVLEDAMDIAMADGFLRKPFSFQEFKDCVQSVLKSEPVE